MKPFRIGLPGSSFTLARSTRGGAFALAVLAILAAGSVACIAYLSHFNLSTAGSLELLVVVLIALRWGFLPATLASITSVLCLNYLLIPPLFVLTVADPKNWVSLATFEATALLVSRLSSEVRLHSAEVEVERKRNAKLYQLSRAILLIDSRNSVTEQISRLVGELIEVERVELWVAHDSDLSSSSSPALADGSTAHQTYLSGIDSDNLSTRSSSRVLRSGTTPIGAIVLQGWKSDPLLADAVASLVAIALERVRALRKENQAEAERNTERLRTAVLDGLAHGFKTPLTAIQTASSGLLAIRQMTPLQTELVSIIDEEATALSHLTTRLLQTAALEANDVRLRLSPVSMLSLIRGVSDEQSEANQSRISILAPGDLPQIFADEHLLKLALLQLIDNALKYAFVHTPIEVAILYADAETVVRVSNEGPPIKPEEQDRIFQRFYRGLASASGPSGTGLGLSIVRKTAEAHGGRTWVDSEGNTTRFFLAIPRYKGSQHG